MELIVVISIISLMSGVIIFQYSKFDSQLLLRNMAYELALEIREAQVRSISVRGQGGGFDALYGVRVDTTNPSQYILFRDDDNFAGGGNGYGSGEVLNTYRMMRGMSLSNICVTASSVETCSKNALDIEFKRPDPDALFFVNNSTSKDATASSIRIELQSPKDASLKRNVIVSTTGQISVQ